MMRHLDTIALAIRWGVTSVAAAALILSGLQTQHEADVDHAHAHTYTVQEVTP